MTVEEVFNLSFDLNPELARVFIQIDMGGTTNSKLFFHIWLGDYASGVKTSSFIENMTTNLNNSIFCLAKLVDHEGFDRNHFNNLYHVFIAGETDTYMSCCLTGQLPKFLLQFKKQTMSIHEFFFFSRIVRLDIFFEMGNSLNDYVITNNMVFLTYLFEHLWILIIC